MNKMAPGIDGEMWTPFWTTSFGKEERAKLTLFWTSMRAWLGSVPTLKKRCKFIFPGEALLENMYDKLSMPLIACSKGAATLLAIVSADAPGNCADTTTIGGVNSGYCSRGRKRKERKPSTV